MTDNNWYHLQDLDNYLTNQNEMNIELWNDRRKFSLDERWDGNTVFGILLKHYFKYTKSNMKSRWITYIYDIYDSHAEEFHTYRNYGEHISCLTEILQYADVSFLEKIFQNRYFPIRMKDNDEETIFFFLQNRQKIFRKITKIIYLLFERDDFRTEISFSYINFWNIMIFMFNHFYCFEKYEYYFNDLFLPVIHEFSLETFVSDFVYFHHYFVDNVIFIGNEALKLYESIDSDATTTFHKKTILSVFIYTFIKSYQGNDESHLEKIFGIIYEYMCRKCNKKYELEDFFSFLHYLKYEDEYFFLSFLQRYENDFISCFQNDELIQDSYFEEIPYVSGNIRYYRYVYHGMIHFVNMDIYNIWWNNLLVYACFEKKRTLVLYLIEHGCFEDIKNKEQIYILFLYEFISCRKHLHHQKYLLGKDGNDDIDIGVMECFEMVIHHMLPYIRFDYFEDLDEDIYHPIHVSVSFKMKTCMKYIMKHHIREIMTYTQMNDMIICFSDIYSFEYDCLEDEVSLTSYSQRTISKRDIYTNRFYSMDETLSYYVLSKEDIDKIHTEDLKQYITDIFSEHEHVYVRESFFICVCILYDWNDVLEDFFHIISKIRNRTFTMSEKERTIYDMHQKILKTHETMGRNQHQIYLPEFYETIHSPNEIFEH